LAVNVALAAPAKTVTEAGTVRLVLLSDSVTATPPLGAAALSATEHDEEAGVVIVRGLHETDVRVTGGGAAGAVIVPPVPVRVSALPEPSDPEVFVTVMDVLVTFAARVTLTTATTPLAMVVAFIP
jgi:hypothetical protein